MFSGDFEQIPYPTQRSKKETETPGTTPDAVSDDKPAEATVDGTPDGLSDGATEAESPTLRRMPERRSI
ncbi:hypothetical protein ACWDV4_27530 [Micromonospora sp. NPDC003197]